MGIDISPHVLRSRAAYGQTMSEKALYLASQLEEFYRLSYDSRNDSRGIEASVGALKVIGEIDRRLWILSEQKSNPYKEGEIVYFSRSLSVKRSKNPIIFVACFPGPSPSFLAGKVPYDDAGQHRILLEGRKNSHPVIKSIPLLDSRIEDLIQGFSFLV